MFCPTFSKDGLGVKEESAFGTKGIVAMENLPIESMGMDGNGIFTAKTRVSPTQGLGFRV